MLHGRREMVVAEPRRLRRNQNHPCFDAEIYIFGVNSRRTNFPSLYETCTKESNSSACKKWIVWEKLDISNQYTTNRPPIHSAVSSSHVMPLLLGGKRLRIAKLIGPAKCPLESRRIPSQKEPITSNSVTPLLRSIISFSVLFSQRYEPEPYNSYRGQKTSFKIIAGQKTYQQANRQTDYKK